MAGKYHAHRATDWHSAHLVLTKQQGRTLVKGGGVKLNPVQHIHEDSHYGAHKTWLGEYQDYSVGSKKLRKHLKNGQPFIFRMTPEEVQYNIDQEAAGGIGDFFTSAYNWVRDAAHQVGEWAGEATSWVLEHVPLEYVEGINPKLDAAIAALRLADNVLHGLTGSDSVSVKAKKKAQKEVDDAKRKIQQETERIERAKWEAENKQKNKAKEAAEKAKAKAKADAEKAKAKAKADAAKDKTVALQQKANEKAAAALLKEFAKKNPYEILGVSRTATKAQIATAYRKLALVHHPDKKTGNTEVMAAINKAYEALGGSLPVMIGPYRPPQSAPTYRMMVEDNAYYKDGLRRPVVGGAMPLLSTLWS